MTRFMAVALATLMLGSAGAAPVQAQSGGFGIFFGDEESDFYPERISCLSQYQVRQAVAESGYTDIYLNIMDNKHVEVRATRGDWVYLLDFNYCTARIESRTRLRPAG